MSLSANKKRSYDSVDNRADSLECVIGSEQEDASPLLLGQSMLHGQQEVTQGVDIISRLQNVLNYLISVSKRHSESYSYF
jgi:hypothetical protein